MRNNIGNIVSIVSTVNTIIIVFFVLIICYNIACLFDGNNKEGFDIQKGSNALSINADNIQKGSNASFSDAEKITMMNTLFSNVKENDKMLSVYLNDYKQQKIQILHKDDKNNPLSITDNMLKLCEIMRKQEDSLVNAKLPLGFYPNQYFKDPIASNKKYNIQNKTNIDDDTLLLNNVLTTLNYHNNTINELKRIFKESIAKS